MRVVASVEGVFKELDGELAQEVGDGGKGDGEEEDDVQAQEGDDGEHGCWGVQVSRFAFL